MPSSSRSCFPSFKNPNLLARQARILSSTLSTAQSEYLDYNSLRPSAPPPNPHSAIPETTTMSPKPFHFLFFNCHCFNDYFNICARNPETECVVAFHFRITFHCVCCRSDLTRGESSKLVQDQKCCLRSLSLCLPPFVFFKEKK